MIGSAFWSGAEANCVVVEADAFKETDVIYKALSSHRHDMLQTAELVLSLINSHTHSYIKEPSAYKFFTYAVICTFCLDHNILKH